jgi:hypothetical protein
MLMIMMMMMMMTLRYAQCVDSGATVADQARCFAGFAGLGFDFEAYDRYDEYFREDSVLVLAQAGRYTGPAHIEEYVRFQDVTSPYIDIADKIATAAPQFKGISDDGTCEFLVFLTSQYHTSANNSRASTFNVATMSRIFYELSDNKISSINLFYTQPYLDFIFGGILNTGRTRNFICAVMKDKCPETYALNFDSLSTAEVSKSCMLLFETLPIATGNLSYIDGYSQGCRALHAAFAS